MRAYRTSEDLDFFCEEKELSIGALNDLEKLLESIDQWHTGIGYSVLDMVKAFEKASSKNIAYKIVERRAKKY